MVVGGCGGGVCQTVDVAVDLGPPEIGCSSRHFGGGGRNGDECIE